MPQQKDLKRLVRARMKKTGEAYTAARAHIIKRPETSSADFAALAGMSDVRLEAKTGCSWEKWVYALDRRGAAELSHREIAELLHTKYKVGDWWAQMVAVGYERIKGLRARGQRRNGTYETSKSRTFSVPVATLFDAWLDPSMRKRWMNGEKIRVRTATAPKSMRIDWTDKSIIAVGFVAKGASKSSVAVQHTKLPDRETADRLKQYWSDRFDALGEVLTSARS
jgi:hypothetical protein